jgi:2'-5' RNA ligase
LAQRCEAASQLIGLPAEKRDFSAHVTLGRIKEDAPGGLRLPQIAATQPQPMACDRVTLFQSILTPKGVLYETVRHWGLVEQTPSL